MRRGYSGFFFSSLISQPYACQSDQSEDFALQREMKRSNINISLHKDAFSASPAMALVSSALSPVRLLIA